MRWLVEKRRVKKALRERQMRVDREREARDKVIADEYKTYVRRLRAEERQAELDKSDQDLLNRYRDKRGRPLGITSEDLKNAFTAKELERMCLLAKQRGLQKTQGISNERTLIDEEFRDPEYWRNPENFHIGFQRFEDLLKELRVDYDKQSGQISAMIQAACNNAVLDRRNKETKQKKKLEQAMEMNKPKQTSPFLEAYVKNSVQ